MSTTIGAVADPLGAFCDVTLYETLKRWSDSEVPEYDILVDDPDNMKQSPFLWDDDLNKKIIFWTGDITTLNSEAIVNSTNESFSDNNILSEKFFVKAGPQLKQEIDNNIKSCKTGDARITKGYKLPCRYIIHTVGPRYNLKYKTAAESALYNCYRSVMQLTRERNITSIGLQCIHSSQRGYPSFEGGHIAIRTVRRFLENHGKAMDTVIFIAVGEDQEVYSSLLPLYFPRSKSEEDFAAYHLPYDVGNEHGEPVIAERTIRIQPKPKYHPFSSPADSTVHAEIEQTININEAFNTSVSVGEHAFSKMEGDIDKQKRSKLRGKIVIGLDVQANDVQKRYDQWLKRARKEDLSQIAQLRCLYQSGFDKYNRPVIIFVGRYFPGKSINLEKAAMYFIQEMDAVVSQEYVLIYLHTLTTKENQIELNFIKDVYNLADERYKRNLGALYVVHPTFLSKVVSWFVTTFAISLIKDKIHHIPGLEYLYQRIPPDQLDIPSFILDYDMKVNGTRYYDPVTDEAIGSL